MIAIMVRHDRVQYREKDQKHDVVGPFGPGFYTIMSNNVCKVKKRSGLVLYEDRLLFSTAFTKLLMTKHSGSHAILHQ